MTIPGIELFFAGIHTLGGPAPVRRFVLLEDGIVGEPGEPFDALFNLEVQTPAIHFKERTAESGPQTADVGGLNNDLLVILALRARQQTSIASVNNTSILAARLNRLWPGAGSNRRPFTFQANATTN